MKDKQIFRLAATLAAAALLTLGNTAAAQNIEGSMRCEVMSNRITAIKDGRPTFFDFFNDSFDVGDPLVFEYTMIESVDAPGEYNSGMYAALNDRQRDQFVLGIYAPLRKTEAGRLVTDPDGRGYRQGHRIVIDRDYIELSVFTLSLSLQRYYKSDWQGRGVRAFSGDDLQTQVFTLDCRQITDRIDDILSAPLLGIGE